MPNDSTTVYETFGEWARSQYASGNMAQALSEAYQLRIKALEMANGPNMTAQEIVKRAQAFEAFLSGQLSFKAPKAP